MIEPIEYQAGFRDKYHDEYQRQLEESLKDLRFDYKWRLWGSFIGIPIILGCLLYYLGSVEIASWITLSIVIICCTTLICCFIVVLEHKISLYGQLQGADEYFYKKFLIQLDEILERMPKENHKL